ELLMVVLGLLLYLPTIMVDAALALASRGEVSRLAEAGKRSALAVLGVLENKRRWVVSAMLLRVGGLLLVGFSVARLLHKLDAGQSAAPGLPWLWIVAPIVVWLLLVLAQLAVRLLVQQHATVWSLRLAPWITAAITLLAPVTWTLRGVSEHLRFGLDEEEDSILLSDDGTRLVLPNDGEESEIEESEKEMITSILEMNETVVREVMVPRTSMVALDVDTSLSDAVGTVLDAGHSRIPIYEENVDQIIGLLYAKDLLRAYSQQRTDVSIRTLLRPAYYVPLTKKVRQLLAEMQKQRVHISIVVDEYGGTSGLVTIEDIIEEIVGDIQDEYDSAEETMTQHMGDNIWVLNGRLDLYSLAKLMDLDLDDEEAETVGGLVLGRLGHVPLPGEDLEMFGWRFTVLAIEGRRIRTVRIEPLVPVTPVEEPAPQPNGRSAPQKSAPASTPSQSQSTPEPRSA
ncbi:MAG: hemolysin family protein, partial [Caldilineaceae bacterium]